MRPDIPPFSSSIEEAKRNLEKASHDKENLQKTFDNYLVQVQTLINQKAIKRQGIKRVGGSFGNV